MRRCTFLLLLLFTIAGCMDGLKVAPKVQELGVTTDIALLEEGRKIYVHNCTKCHNALRITRYTEQQWGEILPEMILESNLSVQQSQNVTAYIQAVLRSSSSGPR